ncbi:serine/threonine protein kinase [Tautonia marina]|uniref:serine/threonine protein kinase n=1 Tax=Tautonia marina TaxID=2653855 RepID=UPI001260646F|nr:serine/threonine-protein kinase [Tautonia marina]
MSIDPRTSRFWKETLRYGLLDEATLQSCWDAIPPEKREDPDAIDRRLARQAIASQHLTLWQGQQIVAGRAAALKMGKYIVLDIIGKGGMGLVFLARDTRLRRLVAIKILSRERMTSPRAVARFEREAKVGAQLQHDNLVRIYDEGEYRDLRYLVMEYIEGRNVSQILAEVGRLSPALAASIARQVALGLEHARLKGLIHRDVNPQNILVTEDGTAKLTDLGLAIDLGDPDDVVTRDGATVGTFDYISPEQARHPRSVDTRSDLYSLGCTLYHMISGSVPFREASLPQKLYAHQLHEPEPLSELVPEVPPGLEAIVRRLMAKSPDDRFPTPLALAEALAPFAEGASSVAEQIAAVRNAAEPAQGARPVPGAIPFDDASDPNGYRFGPGPGPEPEAGPDQDEAPPTRTASAMKPEPRGPADSGIEPIRSHSDADSDHASDDERTREPVAPQMALPTTEPEPLVSSSPMASGLGLPIDLGPEPSLTEMAASRSRSRSSMSRSASDPGSSDTDKVTPASTEPQSAEREDQRRKRIWIVAGVIGSVAALLLIVLIGISLRSDDSDVIVETIPEATPPPVDRPASVPEFSVGSSDGRGMRICPTFYDAMMMAPNNGGVLYLGDLTEPFVMAEGDSASLIPRSGIVIRPHPDSRAPVQITLEGRESWLRQQVGGLTLEDLTVVVRYGGSASAETARPPVIESNGELTLRRCTFLVQSGPSLGSSVVQSFGSSVRIDGCLFRGFDRPLDLVVFGGVRHEISNSIFVWTQGTPGRPSGWPIRVASRFANQPRPGRVTIDRCSVFLATGFLETTSLLADQPLEIHVRESGIRADHLLCWSPPTEGAPFPSGLKWTGEGNRYDLQGASWLVSASDGLSVPDNAPTNLDSWTDALGSEGTDDSVQMLVELRDPSALKSSSIDPSRFAAIAGGEPIGADPAQVGPPGDPPVAQTPEADSAGT